MDFATPIAENAGTWSGDLPTPTLDPGDGKPQLMDGGVKFDENFDGDREETHRYYFTGVGNSPVGLITARLKLASHLVTGSIYGPEPGDAAVWGTVFWDNGSGGGVAADGLRNGAEPGLSDALVGLFVGPDAGLQDLTGPLGWYYFYGITPGSYEVDVSEGSLITHSPPLKGLGPDGNLAKPAEAGCVRLDFPYVAMEGSALGDFVWKDNYHDDAYGVQELDECGLGGVGLTIIGGPSGVGRTTTTDSWGWYLFDGLLAGHYTVEVDFLSADSDKIAPAPPAVITKGTILYKTQAPGDLYCVGPPTVSGDVPVGGVTQGFDFGFASAELPVELTSFHAGAFENGLILEWTTASEVDNAGFAVEQRVDDGFKEIAWVPGSGTTNEAKVYTHRIEDLEPGSYGFRLRQVDYDGTLMYTRLVEAVVEIPGAFFLGPVYPNPFNPTATVTIGVRTSQDVTVTLHDALGRRVRTLHQGYLAANTVEKIRIEGSNLSSGVYIVHIKGEHFTATTMATMTK
jgi:hypothetical protein